MPTLSLHVPVDAAPLKFVVLEARSENGRIHAVPLRTHFTHFATLGSVVGGMGSSVGRLLCDYVLKKGARAIRIGREN